VSWCLKIFCDRRNRDDCWRMDGDWLIFWFAIE